MKKHTTLVSMLFLALCMAVLGIFPATASAATPPPHHKVSPAYGCNYPTPNSTIYLVAHTDGHYVTVDPNLNSNYQLYSDYTSKTTWTRFDVIGDSTQTVVSLKSHMNGDYVTALNTPGDNALVAQSTTIGTWERFDWICVGGNTLTLTAHTNGKYVTADPNWGTGGAPLLLAESSTVGTWQRFDWSY